MLKHLGSRKKLGKLKRPNNLESNKKLKKSKDKLKRLKNLDKNKRLLKKHTVNNKLKPSRKD